MMVAVLVLSHPALRRFGLWRRMEVATVVDLLSLFDGLAGLGTGYASLYMYSLLTHHRIGVLITASPMTRDILFGTAILVLILRKASTTITEILASTKHFMKNTLSRVLAATFVLVSIGLTTRALHDMACLWVVGWSLAFASASIAGRLAMVGALRVQRVSGSPADAPGAPKTQERSGGEASHIVQSAEYLDAVGPGLVPQGQDSQPAPPATAESQPLAVALTRERIAALFPRSKDVRPIGQGRSILEGALPRPPDTKYMAGIPIAASVSTFPVQRWDFCFKDVCDRTLALLLLLILSPLLLAITLAVGLSSPGPILFHQQRSGWGGRPFDLLKFRTMFVQSPMATCPFQQTLRDDPRCTKIGRILRRTSLDELPQLWNVLRGDMSLVGPRPHCSDMRTENRLGEEIVCGYALRSRMKPGLTGWAQVHGLRGATVTADQLQKRVEHDLYYIENWTLLLDLRILSMTVKHLLSQDNAF